MYAFSLLKLNARISDEDLIFSLVHEEHRENRRDEDILYRDSRGVNSLSSPDNLIL